MKKEESYTLSPCVFTTGFGQAWGPNPFLITQPPELGALHPLYLAGEARCCPARCKSRSPLKIVVAGADAALRAAIRSSGSPRPAPAPPCGGAGPVSLTALPPHT